MPPVAGHEAVVAARFDALQSRFKHVVGVDDSRLGALLTHLEPLGGRAVLDLGCGKGRFASRLVERGARVVGLDLSIKMLSVARGLPRVRGSACRLPFASGIFEAVIAVEVFEHLPSAALGATLREIRRVLAPGGLVAIIDKNAGSWNAGRPWLPNLAVKWLDERRGRWMYPARSPVRERWFWPHGLRRVIEREFATARVEFLLSPEEARTALFRRVPRTRRMTLWTARAPGGKAP
jgi:SAM-dependent methyltransferase